MAYLSIKLSNYKSPFSTFCKNFIYNGNIKLKFFINNTYSNMKRSSVDI